MAKLELKDSLAAGMRTTTFAIRIWWTNHGTTVLRLACAVMAVLAALKLGDEFRRLLLDTGHNGAVDTRIFNQLVREWFEGRPLYQDLVPAVHPPATYVLLWPLLGWLDFTPARWLWAVTSVATLGWLVYLIVRESGADTRLEYLFVALLALSMNATGVTIGNGQLIVHILPMLLCALLLLHRGPGRWNVRLLTVGMLLFTLVQPTITAPFLWIALFTGGGLVTTALITLGYAGLTLFAGSFQESTVMVLARGWMERATAVAVAGGYANLHMWLAYFDLQVWILWASLLAFAALGFWIYQHRKGDFWILLGVTALVARLWAHHRVYDDVLILLPMVALFRIAKSKASSEGTSIATGLLLGATILAMLAPARWEHFPWPWSLVFTGGHTVVWVSVLGFLLDRARRDQKADI
jgi:hypothetical protein